MWLQIVVKSSRALLAILTLCFAVGCSPLNFSSKWSTSGQKGDIKKGVSKEVMMQVPLTKEEVKEPVREIERIDKNKILRPKGSRLYVGHRGSLLSQGEQLFEEPSLSSNGLSCATCHINAEGFMPSFAKPYPHHVEMAEMFAGVKSIALDEMIQLCLSRPMATRPLDWGSEKLAAITAYVEDVVRKEYLEKMANSPDINWDEIERANAAKEKKTGKERNTKSLWGR